jgi:hypothetical protein
LVVELVDIVGVYGGPEFVVEYSNGDRTSYVTTVYEGRVIGGELAPVNDESSDARYFALDEIMALNTQSWVRIVLPDAFGRCSKATKSK